DRATDRWQQFVDNMKAGIASFIGQELLLQDVLRQIDDDARKSGRVLGSAERLALADVRLQAGLAPGAPGLVTAGGNGASVNGPTSSEEEALQRFAKKVSDAAEAAQKAAEKL